MAKSLIPKQLVVLMAAMLALALAASAPALAQPEEPPPTEPRTVQEEAGPQPQQEEGQQTGSEAEPKADPEVEPEAEESQPREVSATGRIGQLADYPGATHGINDEATGAFRALRSDSVDLDAYAGEGRRVTVRGVPVSPGGPNPVINVTEVVPVDGGSTQEDRATLSFELTVDGDPPAGAAFYGRVHTGEGGPGLYVPLTDPYEDGVYAGSTTVDRFGPGPRPVPPGAEPVSLPVQILQGSEMIKDFGTVKLDGDKTFSASVSFDDDGEPGPPANGLRGTITEISGSSLFVEEDPSEESGEKGYYTVTDETEITKREDGEDVPAGFEELEVGQLVEAVYDEGPGLPSIPPVGNAASITILEGDDDGDGRRFGSATGILERFAAEPVVVDGRQICELSTHAITDEATGRRYDLKSDEVDLDAYVGERVTAYGELLVSPKVAGVGAERCPDLEVIRVERAGTPPPDDGGGGGGSDSDGSGGGSSGGIAGGMRGLLPSTGGGMALTLLGAGVLVAGGGLLVRRLAR